MANNILNKQLLKKWWFWVIIVVVLGLIGLATGGGDTNTTTDTTSNNSDTSTQTATYTLTGETLGEYGKEVTLNKDSDMPVKKYLYKLPAGTYKVTTSFDKMASFYIVKDDITTESGNSEYPETLNYVGEAYLLTAGTDDFNGKAKKEVSITLNTDESVSIVGTQTFTFVKQ